MFKRATILFVFVLFLGLVSLNNAQAQVKSDVSIGYVDPQAVLNKMPEMKAVAQRLQNFADRKQKEFQQKQADFQEQVTAYQQKSGVISDEAKSKEEERLGQLQSELQQYQTQIQQELQQKRQELVGPLLQQINDAIDKVASERNLTYVFNTTTSQGDVIILYASPEMRENNDITDAVMQELGI